MNNIQPIFDPTTHYRIKVRGRVDVEWLQSFDISAEINADKTRRMEDITMLDVHTDQSGIVGLVRRLHGLGMTILQLQIVLDGANDTEEVNTGSEKGEKMIARIWHGKTTVGKADAYMEEYFLQTGLADYQGTEGNLGVLVLRKDEGDQADFLMLTLWQSEDAIRKFAGDDINNARYYPDDTKYFAELEPRVVHYEVLVNHLNL